MTPERYDPDSRPYASSPGERIALSKGNAQASRDDVSYGLSLCTRLNILPAVATLFTWQMLQKTSPGAGLYETILVFWTALPFFCMIYVVVAFAMLGLASAEGKRATLGFVLPIAAFGALVALDGYLY